MFEVVTLIASAPIVGAFLYVLVSVVVRPYLGRD